MIRIFIIFYTFFIMSCANSPTKKNFDDRLKANYGKPVDLVVEKWGPPNNKHEFKDGSKVFSWHYKMAQTWDQLTRYPGPAASAFSHWPSSKHRIMSYGRYSYPFYHTGFYSPFTVHRPMRLIHHCGLEIKTDKDGNIISHRSRGNNCVS